MLIPRFILWMLPVSLMFWGLSAATAQTYPNKPVRIITFEAGSGSDFVARLIAQGASAPLGQQIVVENRGGAGGIIAAQAVAKAPPDGYTLLVTGGNFWIAPLMEKVPYDPLRDFLPITMTTTAANVLVVHPSLPVKTVKELIGLAKANPGRLNYAATATGGSIHLAAELFKFMAGVDIVRVTYRGGAQTLIDLIAGEVQLTFATPTSVLPYFKSNRLRALAVASAQPSELFPGLPTVAATVPGYESANANGIFAPAATPATIVNRLNQEVVRFLTTAEAREKFLNAGVTTVGNSPEQFALAIKSEMTRMGKMIKEAGIRAD